MVTTEATADPADPFTVAGLAALFSAMSAHGIASVDLRRGRDRVRVRRTVEPAPEPESIPPLPPAGVNGLRLAAGPVRVKAPLAGLFRDREDGAVVPLVRPGVRVGPQTVLALIVAEGSVNELTADVAGVLVRALARDGQQVERGTALFEIDPAA